LAYAKKVGARAENVIVNGNETPLTNEIENASMVEIIASKEQKRAPDVELIKHCTKKTAEYIEKQLNLKVGGILEANGKIMLEEVLKTRGLLDLSDVPSAEDAVIFPYSYAKLSTLYHRIGSGDIKIEDVAKKLDEAGIQKVMNWTRYTTIRVSSTINEPLIASLITTEIGMKGGNIFNIDLSKPLESGSDRFTLRITAVELDEEKEIEIRNLLEKDGRFDEVTVV
jgi:(p)ppGpp synthase/HD superfamily hydrolase